MLRIVVIVAIAIQSVYVVQSNKTQHLHHWNDGRNRTYWLTSACCGVQHVLTYHIPLFFLVDLIFFLFNLGNITTAKKTIDPNRYLRKITSPFLRCCSEIECNNYYSVIINKNSEFLIYKAYSLEYHVLSAPNLSVTCT